MVMVFISLGMSFLYIYRIFKLIGIDGIDSVLKHFKK